MGQEKSFIRNLGEVALAAYLTVAPAYASINPGHQPIAPYSKAEQKPEPRRDRDLTPVGKMFNYIMKNSRNCPVSYVRENSIKKNCTAVIELFDDPNAQGQKPRDGTYISNAVKFTDSGHQLLFSKLYNYTSPSVIGLTLAAHYVPSQDRESTSVSLFRCEHYIIPIEDGNNARRNADDFAVNVLSQFSTHYGTGDHTEPIFDKTHNPEDPALCSMKQVGRLESLIEALSTKIEGQN